MSACEAAEQQLKRFVSDSRFVECGGFITDLDGTAVHEREGRYTIPKPVEYGLKELRDLGRPVMLNSLRFPLSVLRTFGKEWYRISNAPIPAVTLNGSLAGFITKNHSDELVFEEAAAYPLTAAEIGEIITGAQSLLDGGITEILVFYYPRDWRMGEIIWTPLPDRVLPVKEKYLSASAVTAVELPKLHEQMLAEPICMVFLKIDVGEERLMAYQHTKQSNFITHENVDKLFGARTLAERLGIELTHSIGAGDTEMDRFLSGVGLAVIVGKQPVDYKGLVDTVHLENSDQLGDLLFCLAGLERRALHGKPV